MAIIKSIKKFGNKLKKMSPFDLKKASRKSKEWLNDNLSKTKKKPSNWVHDDLKGQDTEFQEAISPTSRMQIGHMGFFTYNPKHAKTLPYYATLPFIVVVSPAKNGFLGINFHSLPYIFHEYPRALS